MKLVDIVSLVTAATMFVRQDYQSRGGETEGVVLLSDFEDSDYLVNWEDEVGDCVYQLASQRDSDYPYDYLAIRVLTLARITEILNEESGYCETT